MIIGVVILGGSGLFSICNLLCGGDVYGNVLGRWLMLVLLELLVCCLVICLLYMVIGCFLLWMLGVCMDELGVKCCGLCVGGLIGLVVGGK